MPVVPGLDRLDGSLIEGMSDALWVQHTAEIQAGYEALSPAEQQQLGFTGFCQHFADGAKTTAAMQALLDSGTAGKAKASEAAEGEVAVAEGPETFTLEEYTKRRVSATKAVRGSIGPAWTRGEIEKPAGVRDMGTWQANVYTAEQQQRLRVDERGEKQPAATTPAPAAPPKTTWPELVGAAGDAAVAAISAGRPELTSVTTVPEGAMVTKDWRSNRVRVFVSGDGTVARPPKVG